MQDGQLDRDGRRLAVRIGGADEGPLVVYIHGAPSSRLDADVLEPAAARLGIRLAALDKPGHGGSDYSDFTFDSLTDDVLAIADAQDAETVSVIGFSAGSGYAIAAAALRPGRVVSVAVCGANPPFVPGTPWYDRLSEGEREGLRLAPTDAARASELLAEPDQEMSRLSQEADDETLLRYWLGHMGPADQGFVQDHRDWFLASLRESQRPGQRGWARDNVVRMPEWPFDLSAIERPVTVWYGREDFWQPVTWLLEHLPTASAHVLAGRGHMVLFREPELVLRELVEGAGVGS